MEIIRKIVKLIRSKKGFSSAPLAVVIALAGMMFFVVLWQIVRLITISAGVKDAVQSAVIATSVGNYSNDIPQFCATSYITLEVPLSFCGDVLPPMKVTLCVKSKYTPKF